jgi:hypothetical protein
LKYLVFLWRRNGIIQIGGRPGGADGPVLINAIGNPPALPGDSKTLSFARVLKYL